jgi:hypothetical protein
VSWQETFRARGRKKIPHNPDGTQVELVTRRATRVELNSFDTVRLSSDHTQVWATTRNEALAKSFKLYRRYKRSRDPDVWEYEVVFGEASVENAEWVLAHRA